MRRSTVIQKRVSSLRNLDQDFQTFQRGGEDMVPIVLVPKGPCCFHCCLNIPSGYSILAQKWNARFDPPLKKEGLIVCWPAWNRISHVVTRAAVTYNAPVANCPTSDNVMVKVDVSFNFQIGPDIEDVEKFVYTLGAGRLQELLQAETEEAIRTLVFANPVLRIRDLREELSTSMNKALNRSVLNYGVHIRNIRITSTELPAGLDQTLGETTAFKSKFVAEEKTHQAKMQKLVDTKKQLNLSEKKMFERKCQDIENDCVKAEIDRQQELVRANGVKEVAIIDEQAKTAAQITQAQARKRDATTEGDKLLIEKTLKAQYEADKEIVAANQELATARLDAESFVAVAKSRAKEIIAESEAEAIASVQMEAARQHEVELERLQVLRSLARDGRMVVTGEAGEGIMAYLSPGSDKDKAAAFTSTGASKN